MEPEGPDESFRTRLIEGSPDCSKVLDLDGRLLTMNAGGIPALEICDLKPFVGEAARRAAGCAASPGIAPPLDRQKAVTLATASV
jgi:hypothetical protein